MRAVLGHRAVLVAGLVVGLALRLYPIHWPYVSPELQENYPRAAVIAVARGDWAQALSTHGPAFFGALRAVYTLWYALGAAVGWYPSRPHFLAAYFADPLPFVVAARALVVACSALTLWLVWRIGRTRFDPATGAAAALLLGVTFIHVRESHQVWPEAPAGAATMAAVAISLWAVRRRGIAPAVAAGAMAGVAMATKLATLPIALPVALGALGGRGQGLGRRVTRALGALVGALAGYAAAAPHVLLELDEAVKFTTHQSWLTFAAPGVLSLQRIVGLVIGWPLASLATIGLVLAAWPPTQEVAMLAAFPLGYLLVMLRGTRLFARYAMLLTPFVALFAAYGAVTLGRRLAPRRPALATAALVILVGAGPALQSFRYVRCLGIDDTRWLAGRWLVEHAPRGTRLQVPPTIWYSTAHLPVLPPNPLSLYIFFRDVPQAQTLPHLLGERWSGWEVIFLKAPPNAEPDRWRPPPGLAVTASHPVVNQPWNTRPEEMEALRRSGATEVARFTGPPSVLPSSVVFDLLDAEYVPLVGAEQLERPGPTLTIWSVPPPP